METFKVVLTFEPVDEILWCDHSNETYSAVLQDGTTYIEVFYKMKFGIVFNSVDFRQITYSVSVSNLINLTATG